MQLAKFKPTPKSNAYVRDQAIALGLTVVTCATLISLLWLEINFLNHFVHEKVALQWRWADIAVGLTIYVKVAIDFAIFMGRLMHANPGLKGRVSLEIGSAIGNGIGTMLILLLWTFFKEIRWLLAIMILLAALVLVRLAQDGLEHSRIEQQTHYPTWLKKLIAGFGAVLVGLNRLIDPVLSRIVPARKLKVVHQPRFWALLGLSFTVPFLLGLDDFAGYIPLFNVVNVLGFATGIFLGHMLLNILLYLSPRRTTQVVTTPIIAFIGSIVFVFLAGLGFVEAYKLLFLHH